MHLLRRAIALAGALALVAFLTPPHLGAQPALTVLRVSAVPSDSVMPLMYADRSGMFRRAGLDVQYQKANSGAAVVAAVVAGALDIGHTSIVSMLNAYQRGIPVSIIAGAVMYDAKNPYAELIAAADSPIKSGADLNGKTIAVSALNDLTTMGTSAWVDANGGDAKTLKFVEIPMSASPAAVEEKRVDAAIVFFPPLAAALATGKIRIVAPAFSAVGTYYMTSAWIVQNDWGAKHVDAIRAFVDVFQKAVAYTNAHHAETAALAAELTGVPAAVVAKQVRMDSAPAADPALIQPMIDAAAKYKVIPKPFPARELIFPAILPK